MSDLLRRLGLDPPIIQAPMAGTSTPALAAAVSNAGALGSISVGASDALAAEAAIGAVKAATNRAFNVNVFCHAPARADPDREAAWLAALAPRFAELPDRLPPRLRSAWSESESVHRSDADAACCIDSRRFHCDLRCLQPTLLPPPRPGDL